MKRHRTTHSDLATLLEEFAGKLRMVPQGYCVSDPSTLRLITDAARILVEQDRRIGELTIALREHGGVEGRKALAHARAPAHGHAG